jgi:flagellar biosynthesis protein FlhF
MDEALRQVREELGPDAVVLHTKTIPAQDRLLPGARRQGVEVIAAVDDDPQLQVPGSKSRVPVSNLESGTRRVERSEHRRSALESAAIQRDLEQVKGMLSGLLGRGYLPPDLPDPLGQIYWSLLAQEIGEGVVRRWVLSLRDELRGRPVPALSSLSSSLAELLARELPGAWIPRVRNGQRRVVVLVGPTGVGKTTTIAKLAAGGRFREGKNVSLITTDTYRIAGAEQLKAYAKLMGLRCSVAPFPADLRRALADDREADLIFIDTVGRSPRRQDQIDELRAYVHDHDGCEVHLVLSATTKRADLLEAVERYRPLDFKSIIATKIDETSALGPILEASLAAAAPISYLTVGQDVPDDIEVAHPLGLARRLVEVA